MVSSGLGCYYYCMRFIATVSEVCYGLDAAIDMRKNHGFKFRLGVPTRRQGLQTVPLLDISSDWDLCHPVTYVVFSDLRIPLIDMPSYEHQHYQNISSIAIFPRSLSSQRTPPQASFFLQRTRGRYEMAFRNLPATY